MKRPQPKKFTWNYLAIAFAIPVVGMLFIMMVSKYEPFGKYSMLYSDMYHQYYPFFVAFRDAIRSGKGLIYSWRVGLGMDYLGLISYYLASPLNLLSVLVPESLLLEFFSLLMPVKLGLAGLFFAIFLKQLFGKEDISIALFGGFYGLCAWALGYQWNIMWLDTFALVPLVVLGMIQLLRDKKVILYVSTLFLAVFANYYIGFFVCIFVFLLFFVYEICRWQGWKRFFLDLIRIGVCSVTAIGMTLLLELPTFMALQTTQSSVNSFPEGFRLNIASSNTVLGLLEAMRKVAGNMGGSIEPTFKEGLPNLYCGVGTILLAFLYLLSREVKLRDKICALVLLLFFNVSFIIRQLDYIWHGFHFTNMIPYRFSFLYSFVMLYMAYRAWLLRKKYEPIEILTAFFLSAALLCLSEQLTVLTDVEVLGMTVGIPVYGLYNGIFLFLFAGILFYGSRKRKLDENAKDREVRAYRQELSRKHSLTKRIFAGIMAVELLSTLVAFGLYFPGTNVVNYPKGTNEAASMIRYMYEREEDTLFFRAETTHTQTLNDGAINGYNGITTFTSSANVRVTEFMRSLGYSAKNTFNRYAYEEGSPVTNLFLDLKYMIERDGKERGSTWFTDVHHYGSVHLLENNAYLPLGFLAEESLARLDFSGSDGSFGFQNELFTAATGVTEPVWYQIPEVEIYGDAVAITERTSSGFCSYSNCDPGALVTYCYEMTTDGFMCIRLDLPKRNDYRVAINGIELYFENISLPQMIAVGDVKAGDIVEIRVDCKDGDYGTMDITAGLLEEDVFLRGYEVLNASTMELTRFRSTRVDGTIHCDRDGLLYTSVPQNGNWSVTVDGEEAEITLVGDCMVGVMLTEGTHTIQLRYRNTAFTLGLLASVVSAGIFLVLIHIYHKPDCKKLLPKPGKFQK